MREWDRTGVQNTEMSAANTDAPGTRRQTRLRQAFPGRSRVFLPIIQACDQLQAVENASTARAAGADGIFLVNRGIGHQHLLRIARQVAEQNPDFFVGVNCLDLPAEAVFSRLPRCIRGVWTGAADTTGSVCDAGPRIRAARDQSNWCGVHFATAVVSGRLPDDSVARAARAAADYGDVVIVRASQVGETPSIDQVEGVRRAIGACPLAVAADLTAGNVLAYPSEVRAFLLEAGTDCGPHHLDSMHLALLAELVHGFAETGTWHARAL